MDRLTQAYISPRLLLNFREHEASLPFTAANAFLASTGQPLITPERLQASVERARSKVETAP